MKINKLIGVGFIMCSLALTSCGVDSVPENISETNQEESAPPNADQAKELAYEIDTEKSNITWRGYNLKIKEHTGELKFKNGNLKLKGEQITGGELVVDMTTMSTTDQNYNADHSSDNLIGHLSSKDFFDVANFPVASVVFKGGGKVILSVRDKTNDETYTDLTMEEADGVKVITGKLEFDRQKYGVAYKGLKDNAVSDDIELEVVLYIK